MAETNDTREGRLLDALAAYYEAAGSGIEPDRRDWLDRHPDLACELSNFFAEQDRLRRLTHSDEPTTDEFGDYELIRELGRGGMGVVFEALQRSLGRRVALKRLLVGSLASPVDRQRFRNEAEAVAALDHPQIIPIHEVGEHEGRGYFTMKLVDGGSLADRLEDFPSDPSSACQLVASVARAVGHAHRRGVLHRDLKPSNILLDAEGSPYVADFGLAKRVDSDAEITRSGALLGSPCYMAPEQTTGHRSAITTATDIYGLGAILYTLLTGRPPFRGGSMLETIEQVRDVAPEAPSRINPQIDRDLETICLKCLEKDPDRRYTSAVAMADDLDRWLAGESIEARPSRWPERMRRWCLRSQRVRDSGAVCMALGLCGGGLIAIERVSRIRDSLRLFITLTSHEIFTLINSILMIYCQFVLFIVGCAVLSGRSKAIRSGLIVSLISFSLSISLSTANFLRDYYKFVYYNVSFYPGILIGHAIFIIEICAAFVGTRAFLASQDGPREIIWSRAHGESCADGQNRLPDHPSIYRGRGLHRRSVRRSMPTGDGPRSRRERCEKSHFALASRNWRIFIPETDGITPKTYLGCRSD